jgi:hypothetical protein
MAVDGEVTLRAVSDPAMDSALGSLNIALIVTLVILVLVSIALVVALWLLMRWLRRDEEHKVSVETSLHEMSASLQEISAKADLIVRAFGDKPSG